MTICNKCNQEVFKVHGYERHVWTTYSGVIVDDEAIIDAAAAECMCPFYDHKSWHETDEDEEESRLREEMENLETQEFLRQNPEIRRRIQEHNPRLIIEVQVPHEPSADER
jgi:hypothetical protein